MKRFNILLVLALLSLHSFYGCEPLDGEEEGDEDPQVYSPPQNPTTYTPPTTYNPPPTNTGSGVYTIQLGAFRNIVNANSFAGLSDDKIGQKLDVVLYPDNIYRVTVGRMTDFNNATNFLQQIKSMGFGDAFIREAR